MKQPPIPPPEGHEVFQVVNNDGAMEFWADGRDRPGIPVPRLDCSRWMFLRFDGTAWAPLKGYPTCDGWVAVPPRAEA